MIFLSVVPDKFYFVWQIELQLFNFRKFGIRKEDIHILLGADKTYGPSIWFSDLMRRNEDKASFFVYGKETDEHLYQPSIRPHTIKQHFARFPELSREVIFYHDSDIIFRELPGFDSLCPGDEWWMADCRFYLDSHYLKRREQGLFESMCALMEIDPRLVEANDAYAGGAQSILKGVDAAFWDSIEKDCERLFSLLRRYDTTLTDPSIPPAIKNDSPSIQSWCTDMWVLFWTGLKMGKTIRLSPELDFTWACDPIEKYTGAKIFHNAGVLEDTAPAGQKLFPKTKFNTHSPYYFRPDLYSQQYCSWEYVQLIREYEQAQPREDLTDTSFLIPLFIDSEDRLTNLEMITRYLYKHFDTTIIVVEAGPEQKVDPGRLAPNVQYHYIEDHNGYFHRTRYNNQLIKLSRTPFIALYDVDVIFPPGQVMTSLRALRSGTTSISYPYSGTFYNTAPWITDIFRMTLDHTVLERLKDKHATSSRRSLGGCVFLHRDTFITYGGENEYLTSWGPDDLERATRYRILGHSIHRTPGVLYHLHHQRGKNSGYQRETFEQLMSEYLKVCSQTRDELMAYIETWSFI